ncbi:MAG: sulfotransferase [Pseudomonadota bacterium]
MAKPPILISGCPRSGTTFCGNIISKVPEVFEVYEPFNPDFTYHFDLPSKFFRITKENEARYKPQIDRLLTLANSAQRWRHLPRGAVERLSSSKDMISALSLKKLAQDRDSFLKASRISIKDPIAFFSADWLAEAYGAKVIMMCRHPGGIVSSFLNLGWESETQYIIDHPLPLSDGKFDQEIAAWRKAPEDKVGAVILQWKLFTQATLDWSKMHPDWFFCLHDQLCDHPVEIFRSIFSSIDLPFTAEIEAQIRADTGASNIVDPGTHTQHNLQRQSAELKEQWRKRLDSETTARILKETEALWDEASRVFSVDVSRAAA